MSYGLRDRSSPSHRLGVPVPRGRWMMMGILSAVTLFGASLTSDRRALAQPTTISPPEENRDKARIFAIRCIESYKQENYREAFAFCQEAEGLAHHPANVLRMAQCKQQLGEKEEAARLYRQVLKEKDHGETVRGGERGESVGPPSDIEEFRRQAESEIRKLGVNITGRTQIPISTLDLSRLPNPGLPPDLAFPTVLDCAKDTLAKQLLVVAGMPPHANFSLSFKVAPDGAVGDVSVGIARMYVGDERRETMPVRFLKCLKKRIVQLKVRRDPQAGTVMMRGSYYIGKHDDGTLFAKGRGMERAP